MKSYCLEGGTGSAICGKHLFLKANRAVAGMSCVLLGIALAQSSSAWQPPTTPLAATSIDAVVDVAENRASASRGRTEARPLTDVQVASFKEVEPGTSRIDQVIDQLGDPQSRETSEGQTTLVYEIAPFEGVEIAVFDNVVESVVVYMATPGELDQIVAGLGLKGFAPATITDADGKLLGQAYPERGILLGFAPRDKDDRVAKVAQIAIEQIDPDSFLYRAKYNRGHHYLAAIQDLLSVQQLNPEDAESYALAAEILMRSGRYAEAATQLEEALKLDGNSPQNQLLNAKLLARQDQYAEAVSKTKQVIALRDISDLTKAEANQHLGHLLGIAPVPNYKESIQHHTDAIKVTNALADDESPEIRASAKRLAFEAHLSIADNIARGPWKRHQEVSQRWVDRAGEIAKELVKNGDADDVLPWTLQRKKLAVLAASGSTTDPGPLVEELIRISKRAVAACDDPWFRARIQMQTGEAMVYAAQIQHWRHEAKLAIEFATAGVKLIDQGAKERDQTQSDNYRMGCANFMLGSTYAILKNDHQMAVTWFAKAESNFAQPLPEVYSYEKSLHGDRFISMGVSYWQIGQREKAAELTKTGIGILEAAVKSAIAKPASLKIPYNNFGNMQKQLGNGDEAQRYIEKSAKLDPAPATRR